MAAPRRRILIRAATAVLAAAIALASAGCVGKVGRNDDNVGPTGVRPDARTHS